MNERTFDDDNEHGDQNEADQKLADLVAELSDRLQKGEQLNLEQLLAEHPQHATELRQLWPTVLVTEATGRRSDEVPHPDAPHPHEVAPELPTPARFGPYQLLREIGRGGMGVVYLAEQVSTGRQVALKMILQGRLATELSLKRFRGEAQAIAGLKHPNIVAITDIGQFEGRPYFCMNLIVGQTLSERLTHGPMSGTLAASILSQVAQAIHFAHQNGVLHRDLKPSNILLDENDRPFVVDFGLARDEQAVETLTKSGAVIGTPAYMAPEQAAGARGQVGPTSDVYSLGAILYHMLTGRPPFQAASPVDTVLMLLEQDPITPRVLNRQVDRDLEMIAMRCLQKPQDLRYASCQMLAEDLEAYLNNESISAWHGRLVQIVSSLLRETHHANVMENWGLLWMWHSLALLLACLATQGLKWAQVSNRWSYWLLWMVGFGAWAAVFWLLRRRMGPVTFVERQIAHLWLGSIICIGAMFPLESVMALDPLTLSPILALFSGMVFLVKASILSGSFYVSAIALFATAFLMAAFPQVDLLMFGIVSAGCFFLAGWKYHRPKQQRDFE